jgi:hypothetical protein
MDAGIGDNAEDVDCNDHDGGHENDHDDTDADDDDDDDDDDEEDAADEATSITLAAMMSCFCFYLLF